MLPHVTPSKDSQALLPFVSGQAIGQKSQISVNNGSLEARQLQNMKRSVGGTYIFSGAPSTER